MHMFKVCRGHNHIPLSACPKVNPVLDQAGMVLNNGIERTNEPYDEQLHITFLHLAYLS